MICRYRLFGLCLILFFFAQVEAKPQKLTKKNPSSYVSDEVWEKVQDYLIPKSHPAKKKLDQIFSHSRAIRDHQSMIEAGFVLIQFRSFPKITVAKHPHLSGYIIKAYLDCTPIPNNKTDYEKLMGRIDGARLLREYIQSHDYEHLFKVPEKWLYLLPDSPSPPPHSLRKCFILIENDMHIFDTKKNLELWKSERVTKELLDALYIVTTANTLSDSVAPRNCPFAKDGKITFIDTGRFHTGFMKYYKLTPFLSRPMRTYWKEITNSKGKETVYIENFP